MTPNAMSTLRAAERVLQRYDVKGQRASSAEVQDLVTLLAKVVKLARWYQESYESLLDHQQGAAR